ncbi:unnamed protein product [Sphagnum troendelagicum]|uniref:Cytochrome b561 domain-containing protein n=1 Tax=Sphagnum troendelagicum TaxID=128251 RepID=A0ABP0TQL9_9BRYO
MASFVPHGMRLIRGSCGAFAFLISVGVCLGAVVHEVQAQAGLTSAVAAASAPALASGSLDSSRTGSEPEAPPPAIGYYKAHGWLLWLAFGVFFPAGVLVSKYTQASFPHWFHLHRILEVVGVAAATVGLAIGLRKFDALHDSLHAELGLAIGCLIWAQPLVALLLRPKKGQSLRATWYVSHWLIGTGAILLGWFNIFLGLDLFYSDYPEEGTGKWLKTAFSVQVAVLSFVYLFLERLPHVCAQSRSSSSNVEPGINLVAMSSKRVTSDNNNNKPENHDISV